MKLAYMYATPEVAPAKVTAIQGDADRCFALIAEAGFEGVELLVRDPRALDHAQLERQLAAAGLQMPAICTGEVYGEDLLSFADPVPERRAEALERMLSAMDLAARFGAMVNIGRFRGRYREDVAPEQTRAWLREGIWAAAAARPETKIVLEPVNRHYENFLMGTAESVDFVAALERPNIGLMLDLAHITIEGEDHADSLRRGGQYFWHYHVCDSERQACGDGTWNITKALDELVASGYDGWITAEHFQLPDAATALSRSARYLGDYFGWTMR